MSAPQQRLGHRAELACAAWLGGRGWQVLEHRWRSASGEIDLVCLDPGGTLVAVEVKLRRTGRAGSAAEAVDARRVIRLRRTLLDYAAQRRVASRSLRIDLVAIEPSGGAAAWRLSRWAGIDQW